MGASCRGRCAGTRTARSPGISSAAGCSICIGNSPPSATSTLPYPALRSPNFFPFPFNHPDGYGAFLDQDVVIYHRWGPATDGRMERFIVVVNYSDFDQRVDIPFPSNGRWEDLLNGGFVSVDGFRLANQRIFSNWARIYYQRG